MVKSRDADFWIEQLELENRPEGSYYRETYKSGVIVDGDNLPDRFDKNRSALSSIYYLLEEDDFSAFHRIDSDELWHFYRGDPLRLYILDDSLESIILGHDQFQTVVPHNTWFAAEIASDVNHETDHGYSLVGCDVVPAFDDQL